MSKNDYEPSQYGCAGIFLIITALIIVGVIATGGKLLTAIFGG